MWAPGPRRAPACLGEEVNRPAGPDDETITKHDTPIPRRTINHIQIRKIPAVKTGIYELMPQYQQGWHAPSMHTGTQLSPPGTPVPPTAPEGMPPIEEELPPEDADPPDDAPPE